MTIHQFLLAGALVALAAASVRAASSLSTLALERVVAAAALGATAAAVHCLALGLVDLGTNPVALFVAAVGTWLAARRLIPAPGVSLWEQLPTAWERLSPGARLAAGALAGAGAAWTLWLLRYPAYGWDGLTYYIPEIVGWVHNGSPGSIQPILPGWAVANYPLTNQVLLGWGSGLGRSFAWITVWPTLMLGLLGISGWLGLRALRVPRAPAALAAASICAAPLLTSYQQNGPSTDLPALAWLVACGALCAAATRVERAELLVPAVLAAGLSVGTKTTTAPLAAIVLGVTVYRLRAHLRPVATALTLAVGAAVLVGGTWYLRNLIEHGSPTWPFFPLPWGDPAPYTASSYNTTFLARPLETLQRFDDPGYVRDLFVGGLLVLAGAIVAPLVARTRAVAAGAAATALSLVLWANAPATGAPDPNFTGDLGGFFSSPRYLLPGVAAATLTLALAARGGGRRAIRVWTAVLAAALCANVWQQFRLGFPSTPSAWTPIVGALIGAVAAVVIGRRVPLRLPRAAWAGVTAVALGGALAVAAPGLEKRHARLGFADAGLIRWFSGPAADGRPIHMAPVMIGILAGKDLGRRLEPIARRESCRRLAARARAGWVVVVKFSMDPVFGPSTTRNCVSRWRPRFEDTANWVYGPGSTDLGAGPRPRVAGDPAPPPQRAGD